LRHAAERLRASKANVALVPTMGALDDGICRWFGSQNDARAIIVDLREPDSICAIGEFRI